MAKLSGKILKKNVFKLFRSKFLSQNEKHSYSKCYAYFNAKPVLKIQPIYIEDYK